MNIIAEIQNLNYIAVVIATTTSYVLGYFWYHWAVFGEAQANALGLTKVGFSVLNDRFVLQTAERQVKRSDFRKYVLNSNKLRAEEAEAEIEIVSPVLKEGKYKWKGIYNDQTIGFDMLDLAFKDMVLLDNIPFQHGSSIICILRIGRELDEVGDVKITGYVVTTVIEKIDGSTSIETSQGKKYRHAKKYMQGQGTLFT